MSEFNSYIAQLLAKRLRNQLLNPSEVADLANWQRQSDDRRQILDPFKDDDLVAENLGILESAPSEEMWNKIIAQAGRKGVIRTLFSRKGARRAVAAAVGIILLGASTYLWLIHRPVNNLEAKSSGLVTSVAGKTDKGNVFLTLADGSMIALDGKAENRVVYTGAYSGATKKGGDELVYQAKAEPADGEPMIYHTITTRKALPFILVLPDGSKVWLNNASSIRYPVYFKGNEREVELTGQAYFEVAGGPSRPFKIKIGNALVEALGTKFDVMAYPDEPAGKISLLDGSVRVDNGNRSLTIQPHQQVLVKGDRLEVLPLKDPDEVLAWQRNEFHFNQKDLMTAMREVARWYQYELNNKEAVKGKSLGGKMGRELPVQDVLKAIELMEGGLAYFYADDKNKIITITTTPIR
jgi:transmembrane sensor